MSVSSFPHGIMAAAGAGGGAATVSLNTTNISRQSAISTTYANLQYNSSGEEFTNSSYTDNFNTSRGDWLDSGSASNVWLERTINSGSLFSDPGSGRLNMATTRSFKVRDTNIGSGSVSANLDIEMWDAASGGSTLDSVAGLTLTANYFDPCPLCCFPPETMIWMGDETHKPIGKIKAGETIRLQNCLEKVGEVIVRENRPMAKLRFADDRELILSVDHPIYVKGKGMAAINTETHYKGDLAKELEVGDYGLTESGLLIKLVSIETYDYPGKVYTFSNSRFFANGIMVY